MGGVQVDPPISSCRGSIRGVSEASRRLSHLCVLEVSSFDDAQCERPTTVGRFKNNHFKIVFDDASKVHCHFIAVDTLPICQQALALTSLLIASQEDVSMSDAASFSQNLTKPPLLGSV